MSLDYTLSNILTEGLLAKKRKLRTPTTYNIEFDEATHIYKVNGVVKRSVTQRLKDVGIVNYDGLDPYYADRGTRAHDACTLYAQGWLDWDSVDEDILPFVKTFKVIVARLGLSYVSAEQACYSPEYDICGKYDLVMMWDCRRVLVELKTGVFPMWGGLQLASYERMVEVDTVMGISLKDGKIWVPADDWGLNHKVLEDIHTGWFDYESWKPDRKRRRMIQYKEVA